MSILAHVFIQLGVFVFFGYAEVGALARKAVLLVAFPGAPTALRISPPEHEAPFPPFFTSAA